MGKIGKLFVCLIDYLSVIMSFLLKKEEGDFKQKYLRVEQTARSQKTPQVVIGLEEEKNHC